MTKLYEIAATVKDNNGVRVNSCNAETLGDYYLSLWADRDAAEAARSELSVDVGDVVDASTEYTIREHEVAIPDGWYFLHPEGSAWIGVEFAGERLVGRVCEPNAATHDAAHDRLSGIVPSDRDTQCDEPLANAITRIVMGEDVYLDMVEVCRRA